MIESQDRIGTFMLYGLYDGMNMSAFHQYIMDSVDVLAYWNHIPLLYMIKTRLNAQEITEKIRPFFDGRLFVVAEIHTDNISGWLPQQAWNWINTPAPTTKSPKPPFGVLSLLNPPRS